MRVKVCVFQNGRVVHDETYAAEDAAEASALAINVARKAGGDSVHWESVDSGKWLIYSCMGGAVVSIAAIIYLIN
jgi:hypothetical protein